MSKIQSFSFRSWLMAGAALAIAAPVLAQSDQSLETVVVTGSLIQRNPGEMPTPTVILSSDAITKSGQTNISGVLSQLPQVQNSSGAGDLTPTNSNFLTSGFGVWNVDLRSLGASRTLVLVNGRRQVTGSPTSSAVDLNTVPTALIDHVDVITGGASAAYGSDAVAGVVNIVLKRDFQGIAATAQTGISSRWDGSDTYGTVTLGGNFGNDKGNITLSLSYDHSGVVKSGDRDLTRTDVTWSPGYFPWYGTSVGPFERALLGVSAAYSSYGPGGRFRLAAPSGAGGQVIAVGGSYNPDGTTFSTPINGYDRSPNRYIQVPVSRKVIAETAHYDFADWLSFFVEATYAKTNSSQQLEPYPGTSEDGLSKPTANGGVGILIPRDNPFMPAGLQTRLGAAPGDPGLFFYRRFGDLGERTGIADRNMMKIVGGFEGSLHVGDWRYSTYYEWGRTEESQTNGGYYDKLKMQSALHARLPVAGETAPAGGGGYVCDDPAAQAGGCVPINLFGVGAITPEAASYIGSLVTLQDHADEQVVNFQTNGSLFSLPAGAVKLALGYEYRRETADFIPDAASQAGTVAGNKVPRTTGAFQVTEGFGEGVLPLIKDMPFIQYLELDGAVRFAHYSTAGDAWSWNYRGVWQPITDLRVRATESSATRAPNISELFSPAAQTFPGIGTTADPCIHPTGNAVANCATAFAALGAYLPGEPANPSYGGTIGQAAAQGVGGYQAGNPNLKPETANTLTVGIVYTPSWLQNFQATVDFYDIRVHGYIASLDAPTILNACYGSSPSAYATNIWCQQVVRVHDPILGPIVKQINFPTENLGSIKTNGIDASFNYAFEMADLASGLENAGAWAWGLDMSYLNAYTTTPGVAGTVSQPSGGTVGTPHFRGRLKSTYTNDPLTLTATMRYIGGAFVDRFNIPMDLPGNHIHSTWYMDLNVSYDLTKEVQLYAGANNLFDNRPPEIFPGSGYDNTGTSTAADVYDPIGLFVYAGVNFKM